MFAPLVTEKQARGWCTGLLGFRASIFLTQEYLSGPLPRGTKGAKREWHSAQRRALNSAKDVVLTGSPWQRRCLLQEKCDMASTARLRRAAI